MPLLKVFVSSTCYDLNMIRGELRSFISTLGHEPIMSDYNDVLFDPRIHTHESCVKEVPNSDVVILIIGTRHGGKAIPKAINMVDIEKLKSLSKSSKILEKPENISITQLEILKAIESDIPIFTFIDSRVWNDHLFYEINKDKGILDSIDFPYIDKKETAIYIFEFINFLRLRSKNNSIVEFNKISDIEEYIKKQWSSLFQRLISEQRTNKEEMRKMEIFSEELKDIKSLILTSISSAQTKEIAHGVLKYRRTIEFLLTIEHKDIISILQKNIDWDKLLKKLKIENIVVLEGLNRIRNSVFLISSDGTYYECRYPLGMVSRIARDWNTFCQLASPVKSEILIAIYENDSHLMPALRYKDIPFEEYFASVKENQGNVTSIFINPTTFDTSGIEFEKLD